MWWRDGTLHETSVAPFDLADRGLTLGDGVFDTALVLDGAMVWRAAHLARLADACAALGFALDPTVADAAIAALTAGHASGALRITVTRGTGPRGLAPPKTMTPSLFASLAPLRADLMFSPVSLQVAAIRRNETSPTSRHKTLGYLDAVMASAAAARDGFDDALFLNTKGQVACASVGNIMAIIGDRLVTPPLVDGVLPGIARATLLRLATGVELEPLERSMTLDDLMGADAIFVTNSLKLMARVTRIGDAVVGRDPSGLDLIAALKSECGLRR